MIFRADEFDMTAAMAAVQAMELSAQKEALIKELGEVQSLISEKIAELAPEYAAEIESEEQEDANARRIRYTLEYLNKYFGQNEEEYEEAANTALFVLTLKMREDNKETLGLEIPKRRQFRALTMLLPDMVSAEEMEEYLAEILTVNRTDENDKKFAAFLTDRKNEALISNMFQTISKMDGADANGRKEILLFAAAILTECAGRLAEIAEPVELSGNLLALAQRLDNDIDTEIGKVLSGETLQSAQQKENPDGKAIKKEIDKLLSRQRQLLRSIEETDTVLVRLLGKL